MTIKTIVVGTETTPECDFEKKLESMFDCEVDKYEKEGYNIIPNTFRMSESSVAYSDDEAHKLITLAILMEKVL